MMFGMLDWFNMGHSLDEEIFGYSKSVAIWETLEETTLMFFGIQEINSYILGDYSRIS